MWDVLPTEQKQEYKKIILAFASLSEMFAQKADTSTRTICPVINSKFQERVFQIVFHATLEDLANSPFDASIHHKNANHNFKFLVGIKTFGFKSKLQKVAQFKSKHQDWSNLISKIENNAHGLKDKNQINKINHSLYLELAKEIAFVRNLRIKSAQEELKGFTYDNTVQSVYHVLMPTVDHEPKIHVGETNYDQIDIDHIEIIGCTNPKNPINFNFTDGFHEYHFTSADSQLLMNFNNNEIVKESWNVNYAKDPYQIFREIADEITPNSALTLNTVTQSHSWKITNKNDEVELFSGFNAFYAVGPKIARNQRKKKLNSIARELQGYCTQDILVRLLELLNEYIAYPNENKQDKVCKRKEIIEFINTLSKRNEIKQLVDPLLFRPMNELYIPLPRSREFHFKNPNFFVPNLMLKKKLKGSWKLDQDKTKRTFTLIIEPSGEEIEAFVTQDNGKAIQSLHSQSELGEWLLRKVFQLKEYEPLTKKRLDELEVNGIRMYRVQGNNAVHMEFIWIDEDNLPNDYLDKTLA